MCEACSVGWRMIDGLAIMTQLGEEVVVGGAIRLMFESREVVGLLLELFGSF